VSAEPSDIAAAVRQQALSLVLPVREGQGERLGELLRERRRAVQQALRRVTTLHFGRFVVLPPEQGAAGPHQLVFESNFDGELGPHLDELCHALGPALDEIFSSCERAVNSSRRSEFKQFVVRESLRARAFYAAHSGLSVKVIHNDRALRRAAESYLADRQRAGDLGSQGALALARELQAHVLGVALPVDNLYVGSVERWLPAVSGGVLAVALARPLQFLWAFLLAPIFELRDRFALGNATDAPEIRRRRDEIGLDEDRLQQNGLTHLVAIKPGRYRHTVLRLMLRIADALATFGAQDSRLGSLETIHFARWLILPDHRLLFLSNYDGSWEAYLGDFIDKASKGLTMIWTNTRLFPKTRFLLWQGATDEEAFKRWTRSHQLPTQIWYSAYPDLSVADVLHNARLRELLASELDETHARALLEVL
jgi:hypothetical protein